MWRHELRADDHDLGLRVVDDLRDLGRRQPPVDRHVDRAELGQAEGDLEPLEAVLVEERDPVVTLPRRLLATPAPPGSTAGRARRR